MRSRSVLKVRERRCDASCYGARGGDCACVCGGRNHALGSLEKARARTQEDVRAGRYGERIQQMRSLAPTIRLLPGEVGGVEA